MVTKGTIQHYRDVMVTKGTIQHYRDVMVTKGTIQTLQGCHGDEKYDANVTGMSW